MKRVSWISFNADLQSTQRSQVCACANVSMNKSRAFRRSERCCLTRFKTTTQLVSRSVEKQVTFLTKLK